ncbi:MAG: hypothetical protein GY822_22155 [Deltaproteobacteria bacterium]|nr:hypothetical protein [Deltaproteobacteria bacterium]
MGFIPLNHTTWMAIGIAPFLTAFVVVEICAVVVPQWRSLRITGPEGRARLTYMAIALGIGLSAFQVAMLVQWLSTQSFDRELLFEDMSLVSVALILGCFSTMLLVWGVQKKGVGNGFLCLSP